MDPIDQAYGYITECCPRIGAFYGPSDVNRFLCQVAADMAASQPSPAFPERYIEHVAYAVDMVASNSFTSPAAAVASVYLPTRFEFYFRILSGKLNPDGTWKTPKAQADAEAVLSDTRLKKKRVSSLALAYRVMKTDPSLTISQRCAKLDDALFPAPMVAVGGVEIHDVGDRIEFCRHRAGHGHWGDVSSEAVFYGLMTAIVFYSQT